MDLTSQIKALLRRAGIDLVRFPSRAHHPLGAFLTRYRIEAVFDVGANVGQYGKRLRAEGFRGAIVSVEPDPSAFSVLERTAAHDALWAVHNVALGAEPGHATLHVSTLSVFNSLLPPSAYGRASDTRIGVVRDVEVEVTTVDRLLTAHPVHGALLLKIDTQGFERSVLTGARDSLRRAVGVQIELSVRPLYEGQPAMHEMMAELAELGFAPFALMSGYADPQTGALAEVDGLFCRR